MPITSNEHAAAAGTTGGVDIAAIVEGNVVCCEGDVAALGGVTGYVECTGLGDGAGGATIEKDAAALLTDAFGFNGAAVNHAGGKLVGGCCGEDDLAIGGADGVAIFNEGSELACSDGEAFQFGIHAKIESDAFTAGQGDGAGLCNENTAVTYFGGEHGDVSTKTGLDIAIVDDATGATATIKGGATRHEGGVTQAVGGGDDAADINLSTWRKIHAGGVHQVNLAVGVELAEDLAGVGAINAV